MSLIFGLGHDLLGSGPEPDDRLVFGFGVGREFPVSLKLPLQLRTLKVGDLPVGSPEGLTHSLGYAVILGPSELDPKHSLCPGEDSALLGAVNLSLVLFPFNLLTN